MFYALLVIIVLVAIPYGTVQTPWKALFACCVFALTILSLIEGVLSGSLLTRAHLLLLPLVALIIFCFAQTIRFGQREVAGISAWQSISADPFQTRLVALNLLTLLLAWGLLLRYTTTTWRLRALIYTIIGVGVASALFGLIRQTTQQADAAGFILPNLRSGYGQFINRNHFAFMMEMSLGLTLGMVVGGGVRRERVLIYMALALPIWAALILANSRGGLLTMLAQVFFLGLLFSFLGSMSVIQ